MATRTLLYGVAAVVALALLLFLTPAIGMIVLVAIVVVVPGLFFAGRRRIAGNDRAGPGASGPVDRGYDGAVAVGEEGAAVARHENPQRR